MNKKGDKQPTITLLVPLDRVSGGVSSTVTDKDALEHMSQLMLRELGLVMTRADVATRETTRNTRLVI